MSVSPMNTEERGFLLEKPPPPAPPASPVIAVTRAPPSPTPRRKKKKRASGSVSSKCKSIPTHSLAKTKLMYGSAQDKQEYELDTELQKFMALGLDLDNIHDIATQRVIIGHLKAICRPMKIKRLLRDRVRLGRVKTDDEYTQYYELWRKFKMRIVGISQHLKIWSSSLHLIESHQGSGVLSFFIFLRWLFCLNLFISILLLCFVTLPNITIPRTNYTALNFTSLRENTNITDLEIKNLMLVENCSITYFNSVKVDSTTENYITSFFQGDGWMETSYMFYAIYADTQTIPSSEYNKSMAYLMAFLACLILCFILMANGTANDLRNSVKDVSDLNNLLFNIVFGSWDYNLTDKLMAIRKHKQIFYHIMSDLYERRFNKQYQLIMSSMGNRVKLYIVRVIANIFVFAAQCGSAYFIYMTTRWSSTVTYSGNEGVMYVFLIEFLPSIILNVMNEAVPFIFDYIATYEFYKPSLLIKINLIRVVFLKLASIAVVMVGLYSEITCTPKDECRVGTGSCSKIQCWETFVGQELYKIIVMNSVTSIFRVFYLEIPIRILARDSNIECLNKYGPCEFDIPDNVLDLVCLQALVWMGFFFAPLLPVFCAGSLIFIFYSKMLSALYACNPSNKPYKASSVTSFFMMILIFAYVLCVVPTMYTLSTLEPSRSCGPFRTHSYTYMFFTAATYLYPEWLFSFKHMVVAALILLMLVVFLLMLVYFCSRHLAAHRAKSEYLINQLMVERNDKQYLLTRVYEFTKEMGKDRKIIPTDGLPTPSPSKSNMQRDSFSLSGFSIIPETDGTLLGKSESKSRHQSGEGENSRHRKDSKSAKHSSRQMLDIDLDSVLKNL